MNLYEYQRSRSFSDLGPRSLRFNIFKLFSLEMSGPIEFKFHVEPPWDEDMKGCSNGSGYMTNMAAMPIYGKKGKTMDFSETIVACDIKVSRYSQLNEYMNLDEYQRSRSFIDLCPRSLRFNIFKLLFFRNR